MPAYAVETRGLTRDFGPKRAVDGVTLAVKQGEVYGFLGLNGAGKSTTIKMLTTLLPPTRGRARVLGHDIVRAPIGVRRVIGLLGDEGGAEAVPGWTSREYLRYFAGIQGAGGRGEIEQLLDFMGIEQAARRRRLGTLSTGMKRRVEVARAFLGRPRILFLDEPTRGLDLPGKREMWGFFRHLARSEKVTIFLSSHETNEIQSLCDRLSVIASGRLTYTGTAAALGKDSDTFERALIRLLRNEEASASPESPAFAWSR